MRKVLVTGGGGYVGAALVPALLGAGYGVTVVDLFIYGDDVLDPHPALRCVTGDIRTANGRPEIVVRGPRNLTVK